ncbi:MAG TPA: thiamine pyrophosphate-dependent enzyme [Chloroflexota bacterium]|nr:thiamine pyrophosphate-dependent enzyme [Chloroflexota bacterium]
MNVADRIGQILVAEGVRLAAGITGQSVGYVADALASAPEIKLCYTRQERVAVDICDGYGRMTGVPGVAFADAGPAVANAMGGIVNSFGDSTPHLFIAGANDRFELARRYTKELPIHNVFGGVTKWTEAILDPSQVDDVLRRAFVLLRSQRPGPIMLAMPYDVSQMEAPDGPYRPVSERIRSGGDPREIERAVRLLAAAERPYVYVGAGVLYGDATPELVELAELLTLPVATTLNGKSAFPEDHPLSLGIGGFGRATYSSLHATRAAEAADVALTVGCGFKHHATVAPMPAGVTHIQVDVDAAELHKEARADVGILGDAKLVLRQMIEAARALLPPSRLEPRGEVLARVERGRQEWMAFSQPFLTDPGRPINPFRVTWELTQLVDPARTVVLHDAGSVRGSTCQHYVATTPRGFLGFGVESAMGWSLGAAIGAKVAAPDKLVVAVMGDEAFAETGLDLETAVRSEVPILVVMKNNKAFPSTDSGISPRLSGVRYREAGNYCVLAEALGARATRVEDPEALRGALADAIACVQDGRPALVEVVTKRVPTSLYRLWEQ